MLNKPIRSNRWLRVSILATGDKLWGWGGGGRFYEGLKASRDTDKKENRERYSMCRLMGCLKRHVIESSQQKLKSYSC